ncbi:hypothetical protein MOQ_002484 [Trypanosoma cruzi marinkellei]|uniref:Mitochondrial import inner membrane translocase subunit TIM50 n=1 Tax=Trypanosoma cruzi marinkellei TaxID=85056 RepID=K2N2A9_TRYCR|nr:hypothetical protein MOQ_002484 [Trypanosoma cruzi marinkellei]
MSTGRARHTRYAGPSGSGCRNFRRGGGFLSLERRRKRKKHRLTSSSRMCSSASAAEVCLIATDDVHDRGEQESSVLSDFDAINDVIQEFLLESDDDDEEECFNHVAIFHAVKPFFGYSRTTKQTHRREARKVVSVRPSRLATSGASVTPGLMLAEAMLPGIGVERCRRRQTKTLLPSDKGLPLSPLCIVVDLDETLVWARRGSVYLRPYLKEFLDACHMEGCEVVVWSAGSPLHVNNVVRAVADVSQRKDWFHHIISRHHKWYRDEEDDAKDLSLLGRPLNRVLMLENSPRSIRRQPRHAVLVEDYNEPTKRDNSLRIILELVRRLVAILRGISDSSNVDVSRLLSEDSALVDLSFPLLDNSKNERTILCRGLLYSPQDTFACRSYGGENPLVPQGDGT